MITVSTLQMRTLSLLQTTKTAILNKEGIVSVPRSDAEQTIGKIELNKVNASVKPVRFPDGTEYDEATQTVKKKAGVKLAPGKYNFEVPCHRRPLWR